MIFSLGKGKRKDSDDRPVEEETIERWRELSERARRRGEFTKGGEEKPLFTLREEIPSEEPEEGIIRRKPRSLMSKISNSETTPAWPGTEDECEDDDAFQLPEKEEEAIQPIRVSAPEKPVVQAVEPQTTSEDYEKRFGSEIKSALGPGTVVEGRFQFDSPVRIDGSLKGNVDSTSALIVGEQATVEGTIAVQSLIVLGQVSGEVTAEQLIEIGTCGRLDANISTEQIVIREGGTFKGGCNVEG